MLALVGLFRELVLDFVEPEPAFFVADLLDHVQVDPSDVVDADLVEGAFDERAFQGVAEVGFVDGCGCVHGGDDDYLFQSCQHGDELPAFHPVYHAGEDDLVDEAFGHCWGAHPPYGEDHHDAFCPAHLVDVAADQWIYAFDVHAFVLASFDECCQVFLAHDRVEAVGVQVDELVGVAPGLKAGHYGISYGAAEATFVWVIIDDECLHMHYFKILSMTYAID